MWLVKFLLIRNIGEIVRIKHFLSQENDVIFHIIDKIKVSMVRL